MNRVINADSFGEALPLSRTGEGARKNPPLTDGDRPEDGTSGWLLTMLRLLLLGSPADTRLAGATAKKGFENDGGGGGDVWGETHEATTGQAPRRPLTEVMTG